MTSIERLEKEIRFYSKGSVANGEIVINKTALDKKLSIIDEQGNVVGYAKLYSPPPIPITAIQNIAPRTKCGGCHGRKEGKYK